MFPRTGTIPDINQKVSSHVETVVLLSQLKQKPDDYINVTIELDDMDITSAETKATYDEIKKYVAEHNAGMKVSNLYISQVKRKCGIEVGKNLRVATRGMDCLQGNSTTAATDLELVPSPNLPKNEDSRQPQCPEDKESAIVEALKHFNIIYSKIGGEIHGIIEIYQLKSLTKGGIFMPKGQPNKRYTPEFKIKVVETMHREKLSYRETARQFDIPNSRVTAWERIYLEEGAEGLYVERRGRKSTGRSPKIKKEVEEDLIAEVQRLRAENAYLKKLNALVAERVRQEKKHK